MTSETEYAFLSVLEVLCGAICLFGTLVVLTAGKPDGMLLCGLMGLALAIAIKARSGPSFAVALWGAIGSIVAAAGVAAMALS